MSCENGKIILIKNLILNNLEGRTFVDHAWENGRPSVIISEVGHLYHVCIMGSNIIEKDSSFYLDINMANYYNFKYNKPCSISLAPIRESKICAYEEIGEIIPQYYIEFLKYILEFYNNYYRGDKNYFDVLSDIENQIIRNRVIK